MGRVAMLQAVQDWYDWAVGRFEPRHKGVGVLAVVKGIKANPRARAQVPADLSSYLTRPILPSGWYPEHDYNVLIELLARYVDCAGGAADVWTTFGRAAARHDIAGERNGLAGDAAGETVGIYRKFAAANARDVAGVFLRLEKIWSLYHDTGQLRVARHAEHASTVVVRISGFRFAFRGLMELQTGFMSEYARLLGLSIQASLVRSTGGGEPCSEWHCRLPQSAEHLATIRALPSLVSSVGPRDALDDGQVLSTIRVTSGGEPMRAGGPAVPKPRFT